MMVMMVMNQIQIQMNQNQNLNLVVSVVNMVVALIIRQIEIKTVAIVNAPNLNSDAVKMELLLNQTTLELIVDVNIHFMVAVLME